MITAYDINDDASQIKHTKNITASKLIKRNSDETIINEESTYNLEDHSIPDLSQNLPPSNRSHDLMTSTYSTYPGPSAVIYGAVYVTFQSIHNYVQDIHWFRYMKWFAGILLS